MTITKAPAALRAETEEDFLVSLRQSINVAEIVGLLVANQSTKKEWEIALKDVPWAELCPATIRSMLEIYTSPCGYFILGKILHLNVLHFEDFIKMSEVWENYDYFLTEAVMFKCQEVAKYCNKVFTGRRIADRIANSGSPSWYAIRSSYD